MDVDRLAADEADAWRVLRAVFDAVPPQRFEEPSVTPEGWSPKDVMFHIGAWCAECGIQLERMRMGTYVEQEQDIEAMNREWFETSQRLDVLTVRAEFFAARTRMLQEWQDLEKITAAAVEWFEESGPIHYDKHATELHAWLEPA